MKDQFIPYEHAKMMKELGFDEECFAFFSCETDKTFTASNNKCITHRNTFLSIKGKEPIVYTPEPKDADTNPNYERLKWGMKITCPLYQQAEEWLHKEYSIAISGHSCGSSSSIDTFHYDIYSTINAEDLTEGIEDDKNFFDSPITAHREGILKAIEYLHSQKK